MATNRTAIASIAAGAVVLAAGAGIVGNNLNSSATATDPTQKNCDLTGMMMTAGECGAASLIRVGSLVNIQPAVQFCKWKAANPGEWARLNSYMHSKDEAEASNIVTWFGASLKNQLQAYFYTGAPEFDLIVNNPPNACGGKLVTPPRITGVTPGETDVTVTVTTP